MTSDRKGIKNLGCEIRDWGKRRTVNKEWGELGIRVGSLGNWGSLLARKLQLRVWDRVHEGLRQRGVKRNEYEKGVLSVAKQGLIP